MQVPNLEKNLGMEVYSTQSKGTDGNIRQFIDDFVVEELLINGSLAEVSIPKGEWKPKGEGSYLICVLVKRRWDTFLAVRNLASRLRISHKRIRFAGIKDTKAFTAQHISLQKLSPEKILDLQIKDIMIYPKYFSKERMYSQLIKGNRFHITIRGITQSPSRIEKHVTNTQKEIEKMGGVPNFFGHQRFGTIRPNTHIIGKYLTKGDPEKAALAFLTEPTIFEHPEAQEARKQLQENLDFSNGLDKFPKFLRYERFMLNHLKRHPTDFVGAFRELPRRLRKLFVQAYQSYLFNRFLSERIRKKIPLNEPQIGDYTLRINDNHLPTNEYDLITEKNVKRNNQLVKEGKICVAAPLIGIKQSFSKGIQGEIEQRILDEENVVPEQFKISYMPEVTAEGRLRVIFNPVWNLVQEEISEDKNSDEGMMIKLGFTLNRGSYATVILREFMKSQNLISAGY